MAGFFTSAMPVLHELEMNRNTSGLIPNAAGRTTTPLRELRDMQRIAYRDVMSEKCPESARAQLMRAYVEMQRERDGMRMRPRPKPVDTTAAKAQKRSRKGPNTVILPSADHAHSPSP